jgi:GNAT superfamily N-acetyltransferase
MKIHIRHQCADFSSYRAERVKSLFNCASGANFSLDAELPIEDREWKIGVIVGPSGSGKTSLGASVFPGVSIADLRAGWRAGEPVIDAIAPEGSFDAVTAALTAVGLGDVPAWLRPFSVLSNGEQFRAGLARLVCESPTRVVVDEWTSVIDRQIARIGSLAFAKAWRRTGGQAVLLSCHYDVIPWLQPDWIFDTATGVFSGRCLRRRPPIEVDLWETDWRYWPLFEPHHYLKLPRMVCARCFVAAVEGEPIAHLGVSPAFQNGGMRACRLVVLPEWQGAGIGMRFLNAVCQRQLDGENRWSRKLPTFFHTSHPGLAAALRRDPKWRQCSAMLCGSSKARSIESMTRSQRKRGVTNMPVAGFGGHFRGVAGFKYLGEVQP